MERRAISELRLGMMEEQEAVRLRAWLEGKRHSRMTYISKGYYLVRFPDGTLEEQVDPGPRYQQESLIHFPNGVTLRKVVHLPCIYPGCTHIRLFLPEQERIGDGRGRYGSRRVI